MKSRRRESFVCLWGGITLEMCVSMEQVRETSNAPLNNALKVKYRKNRNDHKQSVFSFFVAVHRSFVDGFQSHNSRLKAIN